MKCAPTIHGARTDPPLHFIVTTILVG